MAVKIRLTRLGRKKRPFYRIIVADSRAPRDGRYIECIGTYNPIVEPPEIKVEEDRAVMWLDRGAIPSDTVRSLLKKEGILFKRSLSKRGLDEAGLAEEMKKWEALKVQREKEIEEGKAKNEAEKTAALKAEAEAKAKAEAEAEAKAKAEAAAEAAKAEEPAAEEAENSGDAVEAAPAEEDKEAKPEA